MSKAVILNERDWNIERFFRKDMPTAFTRQLSSTERGVIHRILSMLYSLDPNDGYLVMANIPDVVMCVWAITHYPSRNVRTYQDSVTFFDDPATRHKDRIDISDLAKFFAQAFDINPVLGYDIIKSGGKYPMRLSDWVGVTASNPVVNERHSRWLATEMSLQETHIKYFEYVLKQC